MEEIAVCKKRRKGVNDSDVGTSASFTALQDELDAIDVFATDPIVVLNLKRLVESIRQRILALMIMNSKLQNPCNLLKRVHHVKLG